jgi:TRAP-type uncharacterized transport system fused permease subunit
LVAPTLIQMGIDPMAAHMFILYYGCLSLISPPVAVAAFVAANLAGADPNKTGWFAMAFGWTIFVVPFLFVFSGTLLLRGSPVAIAVDFVTAVIGVWLISAAVMGYSVRHLGIVDRLIYLAAGIGLLLPVGAFEAARWFNIAGGVIAVGLFFWERSNRRVGAPIAAAPAAAVAAGGPLPSEDERAFLDRMGVRGTGEGE